MMDYKIPKAGTIMIKPRENLWYVIEIFYCNYVNYYNIITYNPFNKMMGVILHILYVNKLKLTVVE